MRFFIQKFEDMKSLKPGIPLLLMLFFMGLLSCNSTGNKNDNTNNRDIGGNSMDSAQNLNVTKFNDQPTIQKNGQYLMKMYASGLYEITASKEALKHSQNKEVNQLAQDLIKGYTQLNEKTKDLANQKQFSIPESITPEQKKNLKFLLNEKAKPFNEDYLRQMVNNHKESIDLLNEAQKSNNEDIIDWAKTTLPKVQKFLDQVTTVQSDLNAK